MKQQQMLHRDQVYYFSHNIHIFRLPFGPRKKYPLSKKWTVHIMGCGIWFDDAFDSLNEAKQLADRLIKMKSFL
jgi:hypothetical protein